MKQLSQNLLNEQTEVAEVHCPGATSGTVLIASSRSLISSGTEGMLVDFGKASLFDKARQQPEEVKDVLWKMRPDGVVATYEAVTSKLSQPLPLGYSYAGVVIDRADDVTEFQIGNRVMPNEPHAADVKVPKNLVARIPDKAGVAAFVETGSSGVAAIPADELFKVAQISIDMAESIRRR